MSREARQRGIFRRDWLPTWETYARRHSITLRGTAAERRAVCGIHSGARDSLCINVESGAWHCKSCLASGGDVLAYHQQATGATFEQAARELGAWEGDDSHGGHRTPSTTAPTRPVAASKREVLAYYGRELWDACRPVSGEARAYLEARCCVLPPTDGDLRWHPTLKHPPSGQVGPALVALVTDAVTREPRTLHRTWIRADGSKAAFDPPRMLLGGHRKAGGVVRLWPDEAVTHGLGVAEGIETALSLAHAFTPVWACIDAGNLAAFPVLAGIESLTIAADHDPAGIGAANACANRWARADRAAYVVLPKQHKADLNDLARAA